MQNAHETEPTPIPTYVLPAVQSSELAPDTLTNTPNERELAENLMALCRLKRRQKYRYFKMLGSIVLVLLLAAVEAGTAMGLFHLFSWLFGAVWLCFAVPGFIVLSLRRIFKPTGMNAEPLLQSGGIKSIGPLLETLRFTYEETDKRAIYEDLTPLLPQLRASDANLLTAHQRSLLCFYLQNNARPEIRLPYRHDYCLAALKALEQIGDKKEVPVVEGLVKMTPQTPAQRLIWSAACDCLPALQENLGVVHSSKTLLRSATQSDSSGKTLLRPAAATEDPSPQQLLRAASPEEQTP